MIEWRHASLNCYFKQRQAARFFWCSSSLWNCVGGFAGLPEAVRRRCNFRGSAIALNGLGRWIGQGNSNFSCCLIARIQPRSPMLQGEVRVQTSCSYSAAPIRGCPSNRKSPAKRLELSYAPLRLVYNSTFVPDRVLARMSELGDHEKITVGYFARFGKERHRRQTLA